MAVGKGDENNSTEGELTSDNGNEIQAEASAKGEELKEKDNENKNIKPWEQHAAVISIPRFDYNAPSAILNQSHSGFLITCSIRREKSATKEAISILEKVLDNVNESLKGFISLVCVHVEFPEYIRSLDCKSSECLENFNSSERIKRRKISTDETGGPDNEDSKSNSITEDTDGNSEKTDKTEETSFSLSLVKLTKSGLLLLTFLEEKSDTIDIVSDIFQRLESGSLKSPLWCHRIFPIQATCQLEEKELHSVVSKLVRQFVDNKQEKLARPIKFAVGYNRRGLEETQGKVVKNTSGDSNVYLLLDRNKCFEIVASAVKHVVSDSAVDLKSPELSILVELLPLSGVPHGSLVAAVSLLPQNLVNVKPRLCIKPLVSDSKLKNSKG